MFANNEVYGIFHIGTHEKRSNFKGNMKLNDETNIMDIKRAGSYDYLKKQEYNVDSVHDGTSTFVFGSNLSNAYDDNCQRKVSHDTKTSNTLDLAYIWMFLLIVHQLIHVITLCKVRFLTTIFM